MIPFEIGMTLEKAISRQPVLKQAIKDDDEVQEIMNLSFKLEGGIRNIGKHAGGVVIAPGSLADFSPIYFDSDTSSVLTQFDKDDVEKIGLVKFDFLGLKTLTVIDKTEKLIKKMPGLSRVYYCNSGSEANEKAFKMVRQIAHKKYGGKKNKILYRDRDYHGTTIAALSAGGQDERNAQYGPFTPGFIRVPHCLEYRAQWDLSGEAYGKRAADAIEEVILVRGSRHSGGLCLEPVTAGGGVITPPRRILGPSPRTMSKIMIYFFILMKLYAALAEQVHGLDTKTNGIKPDMVTMAKGVGFWLCCYCMFSYHRGGV